MKKATTTGGNVRSTEGFTLIEVLVASAVLVMLVVLVAEMVSSASLVTKQSSRQMDADDEARMVFDRMAGDFQQMLRRADVNPLFLATNGNDQFYFYSQAPGYSTNSGTNVNSEIALVGYMVTTNGLARLGAQQSWDTLIFSSLSNTLITNVEQITNSDLSTNPSFHVIAPSVFRMEFALRMKPGSTNNPGLPPAYQSGVTTNGTNVYFQTNNAGQSLNDVAAIVVALGILDQTSQVILQDTQGQLNLVATNMPDAGTNNSASGGLLTGPSTNGIAADQWITNALQVSGLPAAARSQIRVYERTFPISP